MPTGETYIIPTKMDTTGVKAGVLDIKGELLDLAKGALPIMGVGAAVQFVSEQMVDAVKQTIDYATEVRNLSLASGTTAEQSSRLIQVMDDYKITTDDLFKATKKLTAQGYAPNIDTIATLSEQYLSLTTAQERNDFITKNLGKDTAKWHELLSKGPDLLREQNDAVSDGLILSQEQVDQAREAEIAMDNWNDAVQEFKTTLALGAIPVMTDFVNGINEGNRAAEIMVEQGLNPANKASQEYRDALKQAHEEQEEATAAMLEHREGAQSTAGSLQDLEAATKELTDANKEYLSALDEVTESDRQYQEQQQELSAEHATLLAEKQKLIDQGWWAESEAVLDVNAKLAENEQAQQQNADDYEKQSHRRIVAALTEYAIKDGLSDDEVVFLQDLQKQYGLITDANIANLKREQDEINRYKAQLDSIPERKTTTVDVVYNPLGQEVGAPANTHDRASGGPVIGGQSYDVAEFFRPEVFTPSTSGRVDPISREPKEVVAKVDEERLVRLFVSALQQGATA